MNFTALTAHVILGAFAVTFSEGITGVHFSIGTNDTDPEEQRILTYIKEAFPDVAKLFPYLYQCNTPSSKPTPSINSSSMSTSSSKMDGNSSTESQ